VLNGKENCAACCIKQRSSILAHITPRNPAHNVIAVIAAAKWHGKDNHCVKKILSAKKRVGTQNPTAVAIIPPTDAADTASKIDRTGAIFCIYTYGSRDNKISEGAIQGPKGATIET
jgi:hypothetical protein